MAYLQAPIETDYNVLLREALEAIQEKFPGWRPSRAHLEVALLEEMTRVAQETAVVAAQVPDRIFERFGEEFFGLEATPGVRAEVDVQFTMLTDDGYAIPSGTEVGWEAGVNEIMIFRTKESLAINPGSTEGTVTAEALEVGTAYNDLGPGTALIVDALAGVTEVEFLTESSGGVDQESPEEYRDRLTEELQLQAPRTILPEDFAILARRVEGVLRALAIDGYDADNETHDNERMITVALMDDAGKPVDQEIKDQVLEDLERFREVNFVVHAMDPDYTEVDVVYEVGIDGDAEEADVLERCDEAIKGYLDPTRFAGGDRQPPQWFKEPRVSRNQIIGALAGVDGVSIVEDVTLNGAAEDVMMDGEAPVPAPLEAPEGGDPWTAPSTISGSVT